MAAPGLSYDMRDLLAACELLVAACGILVPWPGIKSGTLALRLQSLSHWTAREAAQLSFNISMCSATGNIEPLKDSLVWLTIKSKYLGIGKNLGGKKIWAKRKIKLL